MKTYLIVIGSFLAGTFGSYVTVRLFGDKPSETVALIFGLLVALVAATDLILSEIRTLRI
jgi:hypothetical protein